MFIKKPVRSKAGITVLTVVLKPRKCNHGACIYCPGGDNVPQSYTDKSPAIMRALSLKYDIKKQVNLRMKVLKEMNHPTDKLEVIILGGTFLQYPVKYQEYVIKTIYDTLNNKKSKSLSESKKLNEKSKQRVVALCIENRPDNCSEKEIKRMLNYGCTRVELGVQIIDDEIYKKINRGHTVQDVINATQKLKDSGFKVGYHIMPGLPYSNPQKDIELFKKIFNDEKFKPDQIKIYPCQVIENSALAKIWKKIGFKPYNSEETKIILEKMLKIIPRYCRVMRIMREIPPSKIVAGNNDISLREQVEQKLKKEISQINEIRMREVGFQNNILLNKEKLKLNILEYKSSKGKEFFLEIVNDKNILFGLLRLRFPYKPFINELNKKTSIIREIHIYGKALSIGEKKEDSSQHQGLGKQLMIEAEKISKRHNYKKIAVISGVGVREYYRKLGYHLNENYMVKKL